MLDVGFFLEGGHRVLGCVRVNNLKLAAAEPLLLVDSAPPPPPPLEVFLPEIRAYMLLKETRVLLRCAGWGVESIRVAGNQQRFEAVMSQSSFAAEKEGLVTVVLVGCTCAQLLQSPGELVLRMTARTETGARYFGVAECEEHHIAQVCTP